MAFSLKALIAEQKSVGQSVGQVWDKPPNSCPTQKSPWDKNPALENDAVERAAIIEFDGRLPREWAEGYARLLSLPRPNGVTSERWLQLIDDAGLLLDRWGIKLAELQWDTTSVFAVPRDLTSSRCDEVGLAWLLKGLRVVAMTPEHVGVQIRPGLIQRIYRRPAPVGGALLWEIES